MKLITSKEVHKVQYYFLGIIPIPYTLGFYITYRHMKPWKWRPRFKDLDNLNYKLKG